MSSDEQTPPTPAPQEPTDPNLRELLAVERERLAVADRRTEAVRAAIDASDAADHRQFEFHMARLNSDDADRIRRFGFGRTISYGGGLAALVVLALLFFLVFWGTEQQSQIALQILKLLVTAVAGWGVIGGILRYLRRFFT